MVPMEALRHPLSITATEGLALAVLAAVTIRFQALGNITYITMATRTLSVLVG